jgi:hypothetical protein
MNKHIELVKKWISDPKSVTQQELKDGRDEAEAAYVDAAAYYPADADAASAYCAAASAYYAIEYAASAYYPADADNVAYAHYARKWVKQHKELLALCNGI